MATTSQKSGYLHPSSVLMLFFGFAAGLPIVLIFSSLGLWLREAGIDRSVVTMFSWAALGYSFKFIWAPLIDSLPVPLLTRQFGRRRAWLLVAQLGVVLAICLMAMTNPANPNLLNVMAMGAVLLGFSSATQDIVIDAYRIESASVEMQPILSAMYTTGYRLGMIVSGAGALYLADFFGSTETAYNYLAWKNTYLIMAIIMGVGILTTLTAPEIGDCYDDKNLKKQQRNFGLMKWYALIALVPTAIYGLWYLVHKFFSEIFAIHSFAIPASISALILKYITLMACFMPVALVYLIINKPKLTNTPTLLAKTALEKQTQSDYLNLVLTFVVAVSGFVLGFVQIGKFIPDDLGNFSAFLLEVVRFIGSGVLATLIAYGMIAMGVVKKDVVINTWVAPIVDFFERYGKKALLLLALIGLYRISDIVAGVISNVFYQDMGFSKTDIANAVKLVGVVMSIAGGFFGGLLALKMPIMRAMMVGALLACATNLLFITLTYHQGDLKYLYTAVVLDNLASGFASAVFVAFLSVLTSIRFTAVQYALFSSLMTLFPKLLGGYSGTIVEARGYEQFFILTFVIGLPILYLVYLVGKHIHFENDNPAKQ